MNRPSHAAVSVLPVCIGTPPPHFVVSGNDSVGKVGRATRARRESGAQSNANQHQLVSSRPEQAAELSRKPKLEAESAEFAEVIRSVQRSARANAIAGESLAARSNHARPRAFSAE